MSRVERVILAVIVFAVGGALGVAANEFVEAAGTNKLSLGTEVQAGAVFPIAVSLDAMPDGVSGWDVTVRYPRRKMSPVRASYNGQQCDTLAMPEPGDPAFMTQTVLCRMFLGAGEIRLNGLDLDQVLEAGMRWQPLVTIEFLALRPGGPVPNIIINRIDDDNGFPIDAGTRTSKWIIRE